MKFQPPSEAELERMKARRTTESGVDYGAARAAASKPRPDVLSHLGAGGTTLESGGSVSPTVEAQILSKFQPAVGDDLGGQGPELPEQFAPIDKEIDKVQMFDRAKITAAAEALAMAHERLRAKGAHPNSPVCMKISEAHKGITGKAL